MALSREMRTAIMIFALVVAIRCFYTPIIVQGQSMEPALHEGSIRIVSKFSEAKRGDIIVFWQNGYLIKRVVGVGGDKIISENGKIYVNGTECGPGECNDYIVPEGKYFVLGDNRDHSRDSRSFGFIDSYMGVVK